MPINLGGIVPAINLSPKFPDGKWVKTQPEPLCSSMFFHSFRLYQMVIPHHQWCNNLSKWQHVFTWFTTLDRSSIFQTIPAASAERLRFAQSQVFDQVRSIDPSFGQGNLCQEDGHLGRTSSGGDWNMNGVFFHKHLGNSK